MKVKVASESSIPTQEEPGRRDRGDQIVVSSFIFPCSTKRDSTIELKIQLCFHISNDINELLPNSKEEGRTGPEKM